MDTEQMELPFRYRYKQMKKRLPKGKLTSEARKKYQHNYYLANMAKAKEYQRQKREERRGMGKVYSRRRSGFTEKREKEKYAYNASDLQDLQGNKFVATINNVCKERVKYVGSNKMEEKIIVSKDIICDLCGFYLEAPAHYCPNCGQCLTCQQS